MAIDVGENVISNVSVPVPTMVKDSELTRKGAFTPEIETSRSSPKVFSNVIPIVTDSPTTPNE